MVDLLDVSLKLNLSSQSRKQYDDIIKNLTVRNKELILDIEILNEKINNCVIDNKNNKELITTYTIKIENLESSLKLKEETIEKSRKEMKNNLTIFSNLLDKEKKIGEVYKT